MCTDNTCVLGVGADLLDMRELKPESLNACDPFAKATFTPGELERAAALCDGQRHAYLARRFCGKEAVFKALRISGERVKLCEIDIRNDGVGAPTVTLTGGLQAQARARGIAEVLLSLSDAAPYCLAYATAVGGAKANG